MRKIIALFLFLIIAFPFISAIEINMNSNISKGETVIASVSGNFLNPITKSNIYFYRGHLRTSFDYSVSRIGENYYIYFQTINKAENNYSINISGVRYMVGSQASTQQISKNFKIVNETADFSVNPGFIIANGNFSIRVQNIQASSIKINLETEVNYGGSEGIFGFLFNGKKVEQSINLSPGDIKTLYIKLENVSETTIRTITLSTENTEYKIPCYVILESPPISPPEENITTNYNITTNQTNNTFTNQTNNSTNNITINQTNNTFTNQTNNQTFNQTGNQTNLTGQGGCSFFGWLFGTCDDTPTNNGSINSTSNNGTSNNGTSSNNSNINITLNNGTLNNGTLNNSTSNNYTSKSNSSLNLGYEIVRVGNKTVAMKNGTILNVSATSKTCAQIKGVMCSSGEICQNSTIYTKSGQCCISKCVKEEEKTNTKLIGWAIIAFIFIMILWFFVKKFKGTKNKKDALLNSKR